MDAHKGTKGEVLSGGGGGAGKGKKKPFKNLGTNLVQLSGVH
jgi:hypothetical protein